jgi:hypothetical protein
MRRDFFALEMGYIPVLPNHELATAELAAKATAKIAEKRMMFDVLRVNVELLGDEVCRRKTLQQLGFKAFISVFLC